MPITHESLLSLESYARLRPTLRAGAIALRRQRQVHLAASLLVQFENDDTVRYQIQEVLRAERLFEEAEVRQELEAYAPLMADGSSWTATLFLEFPDPAERQLMLERWVGIDQRLYLRVATQRTRCRASSGSGPSTPANNPTDGGMARTSAVHFLRFRPSRDMLNALRLETQAQLLLGCDHPQCCLEVVVPDPVRLQLIADLSDERVITPD